MKVYRITSKKYARNLDGFGSAKFGGRWNKKGTPVIYTGESKEIALLELLVHTPSMLVPALDILTIQIPDHSIQEIKIKDLPKNWMNYPAPTILSEIGESWVRKGETIALKIPSCIIPSAHNIILNCNHKNFAEVKIIDQQDFRFDSRLNS